MKKYQMLGGIFGGVVAFAQVSNATDSCSVEPFKDTVLNKQQAVWKKLIDRAAKDKDFEVASYGDAPAIVEATADHVVFEFSPALKTVSGATLNLVSRFYVGDGEYNTTQTRSFVIKGEIVKKYNPDGSLAGQFCESRLTHFDPDYGFNVVDYWLVNQSTGVVATDLGSLDNVSYFYCIDHGYPQDFCDMSGAATMPIEYSLDALLQDDSLASYQIQ